MSRPICLSLAHDTPLWGTTNACRCYAFRARDKYSPLLALAQRVSIGRSGRLDFRPPETVPRVKCPYVAAGEDGTSVRLSIITSPEVSTADGLASHLAQSGKCCSD